MGGPAGKADSNAMPFFPLLGRPSPTPRPQKQPKAARVPKMKPLLTLEQLAELLRLDRKTVQKLPIAYSTMGSVHRHDERDIVAYRRATIKPL